MSILEIAIQAEDGVGRLADSLDIAPNVISNWRKRGVPKPWTRVLEMRYGKDSRPPPAAQAQQPAAIQEVPHV